MTRDFRSLTLLLPGLSPHPQEGEAWPAMPALQWLLSRGDSVPLVEDFGACLSAHFGIAAEPDRDLPMAALCALGEGLDATSGWWLCADPVHLTADRDQLYLSASRQLALSQTETDELVVELNGIYGEDGWQFIAVGSQRWLLRLPHPLAMRTTPTVAAIGRGVGEVLPEGDDAMVWQRVMTEVQMLLHSSPVNAMRAEEGALAVNGLWFWGGGALPQRGSSSEWDRIIADDCLARGLGRLHDLKLESPVAASLGRGSKVLWIDSSLQNGQLSAQTLEKLEQQLFTPLRAQLQSGSLSQLVLELPGMLRCTVDRKALRRWWRRRKPLNILLKG